MISVMGIANPPIIICEFRRPKGSKVEEKLTMMSKYRPIVPIKVGSKSQFVCVMSETGGESGCALLSIQGDLDTT